MWVSSEAPSPVCPPSSDNRSDEWELPHLACSVYYNTVQDLPAMVRLWWTSQEKRVSAVVEKFTTRYVSPVLAAQEISSVHCSPHVFENMTVSGPFYGCSVWRRFQILWTAFISRSHFVSI